MASLLTLEGVQARCPCSGFASTLSCSCGDPVAAHLTVFESKQERVAAGRPVDNLAGGGAGYAVSAMQL